MLEDISIYYSLLNFVNRKSVFFILRNAVGWLIPDLAATRLVDLQRSMVLFNISFSTARSFSVKLIYSVLL